MTRPRSKEEAKAIAIARSRARKGKGGLIVTGVAEIDALLKDLPAKLAKKVIRKAVREANKPTRRDAQANAPKDTGKLKKAIKLVAIRRSRTRIGVMVRIDSKDFAGEEFYPMIQEYGSADRNIPATGYMRRAYEENKGRVRREVEREVLFGLERLVREGAGG